MLNLLAFLNIQYADIPFSHNSQKTTIFLWDPVSREQLMQKLPMQLNSL